MKILDMEVGDWITNPLIWVGVYLLFDLAKMVVRWVIKNRWHNKLLIKAQRIREKRDKEVNDFVKQHEKLIPSENVKSKIMDCNSLAELQKGLEGGEFTSVELLMFYIERWSTYGVQLNLITEQHFEDALEKAK